MLLRRLSRCVLVTSAATVAAVTALPAAAHADTGPGHVAPPPFSALDGVGREPGRDRLTVTVADSGNGHDGTTDLRCGPAGGSHHEPDAACATLDRIGADGTDPFAPVPAGTNCTMLYGGPATAHITGTWHGRPVDASYKLSNGCETARWHRLEPVLPATAP
ncbi:SSI family serine proteinase inhibitor [Streptomyces sp. NPDC088785]|uniref:SSI family serine proteinase inhibitor n=1 Tax=Streptomyces sp. NPDC088785 TaxID=3365897 RepID=UPI00382F8469